MGAFSKMSSWGRVVAFVLDDRCLPTEKTEQGVRNEQTGYQTAGKREKGTKQRFERNGSAQKASSQPLLIRLS